MVWGYCTHMLVWIILSKCCCCVFSKTLAISSKIVAYKIDFTGVIKLLCMLHTYLCCSSRFFRCDLEIGSFVIDIIHDLFYIDWVLKYIFIVRVNVCVISIDIYHSSSSVFCLRSGMLASDNGIALISFRNACTAKLRTWFKQLIWHLFAFHSIP